MRSFIVFFAAIVICYGAPSTNRVVDDEDRSSNSTNTTMAGLNSTTMVDTNDTDANATMSNSTEAVVTPIAGKPIVPKALADPDKVVISKDATVCPNGWVVYDSSCYYIGGTTKTYQQANVYCQSLGAALITIDSPDEWETMRSHMRPVQWTWIGLNGQGSVLTPTWIAASTFNPESLPWLNAAAGHGATPLINCVAYYSAPDIGYSYVNFYDCSLKYYFMCENNSTLTAAATTPKPSARAVRFMKAAHHIAA